MRSWRCGTYAIALLMGAQIMVACSSDDSPSADSGTRDAGDPDASIRDAGDIDATTPEAGTPSDAGRVDAGPDGGDGEVGPDASIPACYWPVAVEDPDAGMGDAGYEDASVADSGTSDAGSPPQADPDDALGCRCELTGSGICIDGTGLLCEEKRFGRYEAPVWLPVVDGPCAMYVAPDCGNGTIRPSVQACLETHQTCVKMDDGRICGLSYLGGCFSPQSPDLDGTRRGCDCEHVGRSICVNDLSLWCETVEEDESARWVNGIDGACSVRVTQDCEDGTIEETAEACLDAHELCVELDDGRFCGKT